MSEFDINDELIIPDDGLLKDLHDNETIQHYIRLKDREAKLLSMLNESKGLFWKRSKLDDVKRANYQANLDITRIALKNIVAELLNEDPSLEDFLTIDKVYVKAHYRNKRND